MDMDNAPIGRAPRASYACDPRASRGRFLPEPDSPTRTSFQRDRDRIIHSTAFRRLAHKTQVFAPIGDDHHRTRLTHTMEVAQIARALARGLGLDDDLAEAVALSHDLGHPPFGHAGEDALDCVMRPYSGFDHNAQTLRIVTQLERRYALFDGLNLCWETLEGLVKHNGPLLNALGAPKPRYAKNGVHRSILQFNAIFPLDLESYASAEAQIAALADDIAYNAHDIDDGLRARLFEISDLKTASPFIKAIVEEIRTTYGVLEHSRLIHEMVRRLITRFVEDALSHSRKLLETLKPQTAAHIRAATFPIIQFSDSFIQTDKEIKTFLFNAMYRHSDIMRLRSKADMIIQGLFALYMQDSAALPAEWAEIAASVQGEDERARVIVDYISGMTDRFALREYQRRIDSSMDLLAKT